MSEKQEKTAFVLMPFNDEFDDFYENIIREPLTEIGFEVRRADDKVTQKNILEDIIKEIAKADLLIAEITTENSNVFYELGVAHTLDKPTILFTKIIEDLPFDLQTYRVIKYSDKYRETKDSIDQLKKMAREIYEGDTSKFSNPVSDFLSKEEIEKVLTEIEDKPDISEEIEEKGLWDYIIEREESFQETTVIFNNLTEATSDIGDKMSEHTKKAEQLKGSGETSKIYSVTLRVANDIREYAEILESRRPQIRENISIIRENSHEIIKFIEIRDIEGEKAVERYLSSIKNLQEGVSGALSATGSFRDSMSDLKERGISREINSASAKVTELLDDFISELERLLETTYSLEHKYEALLEQTK